MNDLVSVIIPVYNVEKYLAKCLESVCRQDYGNIEILLIDDGSKDGSGRICDEFAHMDDRIQVVHIQNQGVSNARNEGIKRAGGHLAAFIDSDDWIRKNYISQLVKGMYDQVDLAICPVEGSACQQQEGFTFTFEHYNSELFLSMNQNYMIYSPCCKLYRMDIIQGQHIRFPKGISYGEDLIFNFEYLKFANTIQYVNGTSYYYRTEDHSSLSRKFREHAFEDAKLLLQAMEDFMKYRNIRDEKVMDFLCQQTFDAAYNSIFQIFHRDFQGGIGKKHTYAAHILKDPKFKECLEAVEKGKYSDKILYLMRRKQALGLIAYAAITRKLKGH